MLVFSLLSPMGEREAQVSQPGTGRAEWGWREDPKVKSKPEAGHKGPRGFDDTRLPPTGPILAGPCLPLAVSTSEPWRGQAQGDVRGGRAQGVPLAPRLLLQHCGHTPPARVALACCSSPRYISFPSGLSSKVPFAPEPVPSNFNPSVLYSHLFHFSCYSFLPSSRLHIFSLSDLLFPPLEYKAHEGWQFFSALFSAALFGLKQWLAQHGSEFGEGRSKKRRLIRLRRARSDTPSLQRCQGLDFVRKLVLTRPAGSRQLCPGGSVQTGTIFSPSCMSFKYLRGAGHHIPTFLAGLQSQSLPLGQ